MRETGQVQFWRQNGHFLRVALSLRAQSQRTLPGVCPGSDEQSVSLCVDVAAAAQMWGLPERRNTPKTLKMAQRSSHDKERRERGERLQPCGDSLWERQASDGCRGLTVGGAQSRDGQRETEGKCRDSRSGTLVSVQQLKSRQATAAAVARCEGRADTPKTQCSRCPRSSGQLAYPNNLALRL